MNPLRRQTEGQHSRTIVTTDDRAAPVAFLWPCLPKKFSINCLALFNHVWLDPALFISSAGSSPTSSNSQFLVLVPTLVESPEKYLRWHPMRPFSHPLIHLLKCCIPRWRNIRIEERRFINICICTFGHCKAQRSMNHSKRYCTPDGVP